MLEEPKPDIKKKITLTVIFGEQEIRISLKPYHLMVKVFQAAGDVFNIDYRTLRFTCRGQRLHDNDTPESVSIEDGDAIDAHLEQIGGGFFHKERHINCLIL